MLIWTQYGGERYQFQCMWQYKARMENNWTRKKMYEGVTNLEHFHTYIQLSEKPL
jgi:hypothetical protein